MTLSSQLPPLHCQFKRSSGGEAFPARVAFEEMQKTTASRATAQLTQRGACLLRASSIQEHAFCYENKIAGGLRSSRRVSASRRGCDGDREWTRESVKQGARPDRSALRSQLTA